MGSREQLDELLAGIESSHVTTISDAVTKWKGASENISFIAGAMKSRAENVSQAFGEKSSVAAAAEESFSQSRKHLDAKAGQLTASADKLAAVGTVLAKALSDKQAWDDADAKAKADAKNKPDASGSSPAAVTPADHEAAAAAHVTAITAAYREAIDELQKVDTLPQQPPVDDTPYSGPSTGGRPPGSGGPGGTGDPGTPQPPVTSTIGTIGGGPSHFPGYHPGTDPTDPTGPTGPTGPGGGSGGDGPGGGTTGPWQGDNGGLLQGGSPMPGGPAPAPTQVPIAPAAGAGSAGAGGGELGAFGAGAMGGLGGLGSGAGAAPTLRFVPGQTIGQPAGGASARAGGVLGAEQSAAGRRTVATAGGGAGSGSRGGAGGGRAAAGGGRGGTRAGAVAGGRGGRDRGRGDGSPEDLWDDGSDWVDDEGSGPAVMR